jgi:hypothetical protein
MDIIKNIFISKMEEVYNKLNLKLIKDIINDHIKKIKIFDKEIITKN